MFDEERKRMVHQQIRRRGIQDPRVLSAFENVPRHVFVREEDLYYAYDDMPLPIGYGQTISQPYIVAFMTELLQLHGGEKVLEVGTGSGYQAAILAQLAEEVHTVEFLPKLAERARHLLSSYSNIIFHVGDGSLGWPEAAPFDGILVTAAAPRAPQTLLDQLVEGGRLVIPVGAPDYQMLEVWTRCGDEFDRIRQVGVAFVLLRGEHGWP